MSQNESLDWLFAKPFSALTAQRLFEHEDAWQLGKIYQRREIADVLLHQYRKGDGADKHLTPSKVTLTIKKKLPGNGERNRWFEKVDKGHYRYSYREGESRIVISDKPNNEEIDDSENFHNELVPDRVFGKGKCEVYAWCLPQYEAPLGRWPIKIGSTGEGGFNRRREDFQENLPEQPRYLIRVCFATKEQAMRFESILHYYFENRGRRIDGIPGKEWFCVNTEEIVEAIGVLSPNLNPTNSLEHKN